MGSGAESEGVMKKIKTTEQVKDLWHIAQNISTGFDYTEYVACFRQGICDDILSVWYQAHSWKEQLITAQDKIRRRNLQIKGLKAKHIELEKQLNKAEDRLGQEGIRGY